MKNALSFLPIIVVTVAVFIFTPLEVKAQSYLPVGPKTNVAVATVTGGGWTECYRDTYDVHMDADQVLSQCPGERLMLSCRMTGSSTLMLLAQGERSDVTFDTGDDNTDVVHIANGVGWYFNNVGGEVEDGNAWGFARAGDVVKKVNCDIDNSGADDERLCWHLNNSEGYRCGAIEDLGIDENEYERIVYAHVPPRPIPTLSEWGMIAMAGVLGIIGLIAIRRKKVSA